MSFKTEIRIWIVVITLLLLVAVLKYKILMLENANAEKSKHDNELTNSIHLRYDGISSDVTARPTMDNYSFAVGVWCAMEVTGQRTNLGYFSPLYDARHFAITNGWPKFNNREGFKGDE